MWAIVFKVPLLLWHRLWIGWASWTHALPSCCIPCWLCHRGGFTAAFLVCLRPYHLCVSNTSVILFLLLHNTLSGGEWWLKPHGLMGSPDRNNYLLSNYNDIRLNFPVTFGVTIILSARLNKSDVILDHNDLCLCFYNLPQWVVCGAYELSLITAVLLTSAGDQPLICQKDLKAFKSDLYHSHPIMFLSFFASLNEPCL